MKLLLDENLPHDLRHELPGHDVFTVRFMQWDGLKNGELLIAAANAGFDAMLTMDSGVPYEQNIAALPLAVCVLSTKSNDIDDIRPMIPRVLTALSMIQPRTVVRIQ